MLSFSVFFPLCFQWLGFLAPNDFTTLGRLLNTFQNFDGPFGWHTSHNKAKYCGESEHKEENGSVPASSKSLTLLRIKRGDLEVVHFPLFRLCAYSVCSKALIIGM